MLINSVLFSSIPTVPLTANMFVGSVRLAVTARDGMLTWAVPAKLNAMPEAITVAFLVSDWNVRITCANVNGSEPMVPEAVVVSVCNRDGTGN